jgi:hypothetical protein
MIMVNLIVAQEKKKHSLADWVDNALAFRTEALTLRPTQLLQHFKTYVVLFQLKLFVV